MIFAILSLTTGLIVSGMEEKSYGHAPVFAALFVPYLAFAYVPTLLGLANPVKRYRASPSPEERNRALYILAGATLSLIGATTDVLAAQEAIPYPLGIIANILFASLTTVAILRYRLLELRVVVRKGLAYTLLGILIVGVYGGVFALFSYIFRAQTPSARFLASIGAALLVAIVLQPLLGRFQRLVDRWFYRERYDHLQALERFSLETKDITDLTAASSSLTELVSRAMQASVASLLLPDGESGNFTVTLATGLEDWREIALPGDSPFLDWLRRSEGILTRKDVDVIPQLQALPQAEREILNKLGGELFIPLKTKGALTGLLILGQKLSEGDYSVEDLGLLWTAVNQTALTVENARLYTQESERLAEMERMEQLKQTLLLTVAHEIKTPLTSIKAGVEMLSSEQEVPPDSVKGRLLGIINLGVERLES